LPGHGWTLKKLGRWVQLTCGRSVGQSTLRRIVRAAGLRWKKCKKLLRKASACQRAAYMERFEALWARMRQGDVTVVYVDESHFHQDLDLGYTWATQGKPAWRVSSSPPLSARINWYGAYDFTHGQAMIWHEGKCNSEQTIQFLQRLHDWQQEKSEMGQSEMGQGANKGAHQPIVVIWDGAPWHRSLAVRRQAERLGIELIQLPAYSPDLNPIEGLWKWMRIEVTQHYCHATLDALSLDCQTFIERINQEPRALIDRLWPRFELDPDYEKLLLST
jgi:transposase